MANQNPPDDPTILQSIDRVDTQLLELIEQRANLVRALSEDQTLGGVGRATSAQARIANLITAAKAGLIGTEQATEILRHISAACLQSIKPLSVAFLGPLHSYSHLAAIKYFGDAVCLAPVASIPAVFDSVSRGDSTTGLVPIENSTDGRIVDTLGMFVRRKMQICGEVVLPIHHNLLSRTPQAEITEVHSKPQALSQCRQWLSANLPHAKQVEVSSTTAAAQHAAVTPGVAAVASLPAGRQYDLDVLCSNIEDNANNITRFAVLGREEPAATGDDKTSLLFQVHHQPGALADAMTIFKDQKLNLTWIESFPAPESQNEYLFFVEFAGHRANANVSTAIKLLGESTFRLDVLGSYPKATE